MRSRMCELIFLIVSVLQIDKYPEIVYSRRHPYASSCEFRTQLVESTGGETFCRTIDEESGYWWVVGCLFGEIGHSKFLVWIVNGI